MTYRKLLVRVSLSVLAISLTGQVGPCTAPPTPPPTGGGGTTPTPPPPIPDQTPPPPPPVVSAVSTYEITVVPSLALTDDATSLFVYDDSGRELNQLRRSVFGDSERTFVFSLSPGIFRFKSFQVGTLTVTSGFAPHPWTYHGFVDLEASINQHVTGVVHLDLSCDPGGIPGTTCIDFSPPPPPSDPYVDRGRVISGRLSCNSTGCWGDPELSVGPPDGVGSALICGPVWEGSCNATIVLEFDNHIRNDPGADLRFWNNPCTGFRLRPFTVVLTELSDLSNTLEVGFGANDWICAGDHWDFDLSDVGVPSGKLYGIEIQFKLTRAGAGYNGFDAVEVLHGDAE